MSWELSKRSPMKPPPVIAADSSLVIEEKADVGTGHYRVGVGRARLSTWAGT
jgi:hypothetical protein